MNVCNIALLSLAKKILRINSLYNESFRGLLNLEQSVVINLKTVHYLNTVLWEFTFISLVFSCTLSK